MRNRPYKQPRAASPRVACTVWIAAGIVWFVALTQWRAMLANPLALGAFVVLTIYAFVAIVVPIVRGVLYAVLMNRAGKRIRAHTLDGIRISAAMQALPPRGGTTVIDVEVTED